MYTPKPPKAELFASAFRLVILGVFAVLVCALTLFNNRIGTATAAPNTTLNFQARLETNAGAIVPDGTYNVEFKLYNALTSSGSSQGSCTGDAACLWTETRTGVNKVTVTNGYLTVNLASVTAFSGSINWDQNLYLTMNIGGTGAPSWDGEMNPRLRLTAVPYAFQAKSATQLQTIQGSFNGTLDFNSLTANRTIHLPDENGTVCLQASASCGFVTGTASNYIQNQNSGAQVSSNFWISGTGTAATLQGATSVLTPLLDTATATALNIGTTNATVINLNENTNIAVGKTLTVNGSSTFNLAPTDAITVNADLSAGSRSTEAVLITQANNSTYNSSESLLSVKNLDTGSTAPVVNITQSSSGGGISLQIGGPPSASGTGILLGQSYTGGHAMTISNLGNMTTGTGIKINGDGSSVSTAFTGQYIVVNPTRTYSGSGTITDSGNALNIARSLTNSGSGTFANTGNLVDLSSNCIVVSGSCTDSGSILNLNQQSTNATGTVLNIQNAGSGNLISLLNGAGTTVASFNASGNLTAPTVNAVSGYKFNGTAGLTQTCAAGEALVTATIQGGIVTGGSCVAGGGGGVTTVGAIDGGTYSANGASISGSTMYLQAASDIHVGLVTTSDQTFKGVKTFNSGTIINNIANTSTVPLTIQTAVDSRPLGSELMTASYGFSAASGWTAISGTGQSATATHTTGNTTALTINPAMSLNVGQQYQVSFTMTGRTAGFIGIYVGGTTVNGGGYSASDTVNFTVPVSGNLSFVPDTTFNGTITGVSIKLYTGILPAALSIKNASGTTAFELRVASNTSNIFLGLNSGRLNTTGYNNTASGASTLQSNTTGSDNTASGFIALQNNTIGAYNTASGSTALQNNTTGYNNTASGALTLQSNTTGSYNTASGGSALQKNTTGSYNTASGYVSLQNTTTGHHNTASGSYSLQLNTTGFYNTASGSYALQGNTTGVDNTASGSYALQGNTTGVDNTASGFSALQSNTTGSYNTASGSSALESNTDGFENTASGFYALQANTSGYENTASGSYALGSNTTGYENTASGSYALDSNTTGNANTAIGTFALEATTTGSNNTALGYRAGYGSGCRSAAGCDVTGNALFGYQAGYSIQTGADYNLMQGSNAGLNVTTGAQNVLLGYNAGQNLTTGSNNIILGANINAGSATGSYQLNIGNIIQGNMTSGAESLGLNADVTVTDTLTVGGATLIKVDSGAAFAVQNSGGTINLIHADTNANQVYLYDTLAQNLSVANNNGLYFNGYYDRTTTTDRYTSTGSAAQLYQDASSFYLLTAGSGTADTAISYINPFKVDLVSGAATFSNTVNAVLGYKFNGTAGLTKTCAAGEALVTATIQGGIVTSGSCVAGGGGGGVSSVNTFAGAITLQGTASQIVVTNSSGTITLKTPQDINTTSAVAFGSLTVGSAGNTVTIDSVSGYVATGTARHTKQIKLIPEYPGAVFTADGTNNTGFMTSDYVSGLPVGQGYKHNYYAWATDQGTPQDYDITLLYQLPSDFDGFDTSINSFKFWTYADSLTSTDAQVMITDVDGTLCYGGGFSQSIKPVSAATWVQAAIFNPANGCTFAANDVISISIKLTAIAPQTNYVKLGEFQFDYKAKF